MGNVSSFSDDSYTDSVAKDVVSALLKCVDDEIYSVRSSAIRALGKIGELAKDASVPALIKATEDEDETVRTEAASVLKQLGIEL